MVLKVLFGRGKIRKVIKGGIGGLTFEGGEKTFVRYFGDQKKGAVNQLGFSKGSFDEKIDQGKLRGESRGRRRKWTEEKTPKEETFYRRRKETVPGENQKTSSRGNGHFRYSSGRRRLEMNDQ